MPRRPINLHRKVREILSHVDPLPAEADTPLAHCNRSSTDLWNLLLYVERAFGQLPLQPAAVRRHLTRLHGMILVNLVETFERYLKEVAAACVDHLARYVLDDRFNAFRLQGSACRPLRHRYAGPVALRVGDLAGLRRGERPVPPSAGTALRER
jgi:hypothetical protein